ncbi:site-2 protease family protein [Candidatus Woesearchaeota archaeon]|nr:MAG: site-2 protease family protein [Candidatus Woesearchaeota archaeon]
MHFMPHERRTLLKMWLLVSLAVSIVLIQHDAEALGGAAFLMTPLLIALFTVGLGVVLHEVAHKWLAQRYGAHAEFVADNTMLLVGVLLALFGFLFAAPGAVHIHHLRDHEKRGRVALAGPMSNFLLALMFFGLWLFVQYPPVERVLSFGSSINVLIAVFNLIPLGPFDGAKVLGWSKAWYAGSVTACIALIFFLLANGLWL